MKALCYDFGGTNLRAALADKNRIIRKEARDISDVRTNAELSKIAVEMGKRVLGKDKITAIGIGGAGIWQGNTIKFSPSSKIRNNIDFPLAVKKYFKKPIYTGNDVMAAAYGAAYYGFGKGNNYKVVCAVAYSTGNNIGIIFKGEAYPGFSDISQEAGHAHIEKNGRKCLCGARGCFNAYVSGTGAAQMAKEMGMKGDVTAKQVYAQNNKISKKVFEIQKYYIATQLAHISLHHRPQLIELFGGLTNQRKLFDSAIKDLRENPIKYAYPGFKAPLIKITKLGDNIGLFGAAAMALR